MHRKIKNLFFISFLAVAIFSGFPQTSEAVVSSTSSLDSSTEQNGKKLFKYIYRPNDNYRILSVVNENVYINRKFNHSAEIVNRISVKVTDSTETSATHEASFLTSEKSSVVQANLATSTGSSNGASKIGQRGNLADTNKNYSSQIHEWGQEYQSVFLRDSRGIYTIAAEYFMPVVRDVPVFPEYEIAPGDTWTYEGHEAHDLRKEFGIQEPFKIPFVAKYKYIRDIQKDGKNLSEISAAYTLEFDSPEPTTQTVNYPKRTLGFSSQIILWDNENGLPISYSENFRIVLNLKSGDVAEFIGSAHAEITEKNLDRTKVQEDLKEKIEELDIKDASVSADDKGITISLSNIQFLPDSAILQSSEKQKLNKIAEILKSYPDNDLLITGHTALSGTEQEQNSLSLERASAVATYLVERNVKDAHHIFSRGLGASMPIADNSTREGMAKNRRVEITILNEM